MTIITLPYAPAPHPHVRRFDVNRDLLVVADLIEQAFAATLDSDGHRYIARMRRSARNPRFLRWAANITDRDALPLSGFVWEENGRVVGNLSLSRFYHHSRPVYLIANVAVSPTCRGRGIAGDLTATALEYTAQRGNPPVWLHVREENEVALRLYRQIGFVERARRTTWHSSQRETASPAPEGVRITRWHRGLWRQQSAWLDQLHPPELRWYVPLDARLLRPGLLGGAYRFFAGTMPLQWGAERGGRLLGVLAWVQSVASADRLWLAATPATEEQALLALVPHARKLLSGFRSLDLEYPAGRARNALEVLGFAPTQTLIWMEYVPGG